jgi:hypothetical protein
VPPTTFLTQARRFACIVNALCGAIGVRRDTGFLAPALTNLLWSRLERLRGRILRLAGRLAAGKGSGVPRSPRISASRVPGTTPRRAPEFIGRSRGWMLRLVPEAAAFGSQLHHLLNDPEMAALVEAAPQMKRLLRPLCRGLGVDIPASLHPPRIPRPRSPQPRSPRPPRPGAVPGRAAWPGRNRPYHLHGLPFLTPPVTDPPDPPGHLKPA